LIFGVYEELAINGKEGGFLENKKAASESTINILHICLKDPRFNMNMSKGSRNFDIRVHFLGPRV